MGDGMRVRYGQGAFLLFAATIVAATPVEAAGTVVAPPSVETVLPENSLQPESEDFAGYRSSEARVFKDVFDGAVIARVLVEPSFQREYAIGLAADGDGYKLFMLEPSDQIWQYTVLEMMKDGSITSTDDKGNPTTAAEISRIAHALPPHPEDLKVARCEIAVPGYIGVRIVAAWKRMLVSTAPTKRMGLDGEFYHFALRENGGLLAGETWSPDADTDPDRLVRMALAMRDACKTANAAHLSSIPSLADAIEASQGRSRHDAR